MEGVYPVSLEFFDSVPLSKYDEWHNNIFYNSLVGKGCKLYSVGINGVDEHGLNDDVDINGSKKK